MAPLHTIARVLSFAWTSGLRVASARMGASHRATLAARPVAWTRLCIRTESDLDDLPLSRSGFHAQPDRRLARLEFECGADSAPGARSERRGLVSRLGMPRCGWGLRRRAVLGRGCAGVLHERCRELLERDGRWAVRRGFQRLYRRPPQGRGRQTARLLSAPCQDHH